MTIVHIPLDRIVPNPWQVRLTYDAQKIAELRQSIFDTYNMIPAMYRGLLQVPKARAVWKDNHNVIDGPGGRQLELAEMIKAGEAFAQLIFGHSRYQAFWLLASGDDSGNSIWDPDPRFEEMPLELVQLSDRQIAEQGVTENIRRSDITWFERAKAMNRFIGDFNLTQGEVGALFGLKDQSSVSHHVRAYAALEQFDNADLVYMAQMGQLPLLHTLTLVPAIHQEPDKLRDWLAQQMETESLLEQSASWFRAEMNELLDRKPAPPVPAAPPAPAPAPMVPPASSIPPAAPHVPPVASSSERIAPPVPAALTEEERNAAAEAAMSRIFSGHSPVLPPAPVSAAPIEAAGSDSAAIVDVAEELSNAGRLVTAAVDLLARLSMKVDGDDLVIVEHMRRVAKDYLVGFLTINEIVLGELDTLRTYDDPNQSVQDVLTDLTSNYTERTASL